RVDAPVWGEDFQSMPDTVQDVNRKAANRNAYPDKTDEEIEKLKRKNVAPFGGLDAHSHLANVYKPSYMPRLGTDIDLPNTNLLETKPLSTLEAAKRLRSSIGRALTPEENQLIRDRFPTGVPVAEFDVLLKLISNPLPEAKLSLVK
ncbi:MAG: hypothetical protein Q8K17_03055, partial [Pseudohongiella sp.]|nr:hypothetical protein [Pseudohongiella sp.]